MKRLILLVIITWFSTASFAQKHKEHHAQLLSHSAELNLSAEQTRKTQPIEQSVPFSYAGTEAE
jgi:hypothetical protein